jgi:hypothetical protein
MGCIWAVAKQWRRRVVGDRGMDTQIVGKGKEVLLVLSVQEGVRKY